MLFALTACGKTVTHDRPVKVLVPVAQSCALPRPEEVPPLIDETPEWVDGKDKASPLDGPLDIKQKAALVGNWALRVRTYGQQLFAATAACP